MLLPLGNWWFAYSKTDTRVFVRVIFVYAPKRAKDGQ